MYRLFLVWTQRCHLGDSLPDRKLPRLYSISRHLSKQKKRTLYVKKCRRFFDAQGFAILFAISAETLGAEHARRNTLQNDARTHRAPKVSRAKSDLRLFQ